MSRSLCICLLTVLMVGVVSAQVAVESVRPNKVLYDFGETATVEVYDGTWHTVLTVSDGQDDAAWHLADIDLSSYSMTSNFQVRIKSNMSDTSDLFYVDDLRIIENV